MISPEGPLMGMTEILATCTGATVAVGTGTAIGSGVGVGPELGTDSGSRMPRIREVFRRIRSVAKLPARLSTPPQLTKEPGIVGLTSG